MRHLAYIIACFVLLINIQLVNAQGDVKIGTQVWTSKNLDVSTFRNGDPIPQAMNMNDWRKASQNKKAAWCYYDFDSKKGQKYGKLYNWYAVSDKRGLAPEGYHVPSEQEWNQLLNYESIGGENTAGRILKSKTGWTVKTKNKTENNGGGIDKVGFNALPGGGIVSTNTGTEFIFEGYGFIGIWWSTTLDSEYSLEDSLIFTKHMYNHNEVQSFSHPKYDGFSVICIKDSDLYIPTLKSKNTDLNVIANGESTPTVKIGNQVWMAKNLDVTTFRNGDIILEVKNAQELNEASEKNTPAWCYYEFNESNGKKYGKLYNRPAVSDPRGLAPEGYHIPKNIEWDELTVFLGDPGGSKVAGKKMKSISGWANNTNGNNISRFNGLPGGKCQGRHSNFTGVTEDSYWQAGYWWGSHEDREGKGLWCRQLDKGNSLMVSYYINYEEWLSVRCIKD